MALIFMEGFDKYGPANSLPTSVATLLSTGDWTSVTTGPLLVPGLAAVGTVGMAAQFSNGSSITRTLTSNYSRLIGGLRFNIGVLAVGNYGIGFLDAASGQCNITFNNSGQIVLRNGAFGGTLIATSTATFTAGSTHYLEWDLTFSNTGAYQIWMDGVSILSGTADLTGTANNFCNGFNIATQAGSSPNMNIDDIYLFDTTGTRNNAVLLTSPRIETTFPNADASVQFAIGGAILGNSVARAGTGFSTTANQLFLKPFTPTRACTLNSIGVVAAATSATVNFRGVVYADNAGAPGALMSSGGTVTGMTSGTPLVLPLTTPQALTAGTLYWLGYMCDIVVSNAFAMESAASGAGRTQIATFSSGAPSTAPAMSASNAMPLYGNITLTVPANFYPNSQSPQQPTTNFNFTFDATVGHEDLFNFNALSVTPTTIYAVATKAYLAKSDSGARTVSVHTKSGSTDVGTSAIAPATTYGWGAHYTETDPNTGAAWTPAGLNAAQGGYRIET